jgi:hypothetical protein
LPLIYESKNTHPNQHLYLSNIDSSTSFNELNTIKNIVENIPFNKQKNIHEEINCADNGFEVYYDNNYTNNENIFKTKSKFAKPKSYNNFNIINNFNTNIINNPAWGSIDYSNAKKTLKPIKPSLEMLNRELGNVKRIPRARNSKLFKY